MHLQEILRRSCALAFSMTIEKRPEEIQQVRRIYVITENSCDIIFLNTFNQMVIDKKEFSKTLKTLLVLIGQKIPLLEPSLSIKVLGCL